MPMSAQFTVFANRGHLVRPAISSSRSSSFRRTLVVADVEALTFDWLDWSNNRRLLRSLCNVPPEE